MLFSKRKLKLPHAVLPRPLQALRQSLPTAVLSVVPQAPETDIKAASPTAVLFLSNPTVVVPVPACFPKKTLESKGGAPIEGVNKLLPAESFQRRFNGSLSSSKTSDSRMFVPLTVL